MSNDPVKADDIFSPLRDRGLRCEEFSVPWRGGTIPAVIVSPAQDQLHPDPVLLLTIGGASTHFLPPNQQPAEFFWRRGHRVVTFSFNNMPGDLHDLRDNLMRDPPDQPFTDFIEQAQAVIAHCVEKKWARRGRVVVTGISRFAYLALRLMAADETLNVGGGFAPVTDWRDLSEFAEQRHLPRIADLRLSLLVDKLAGRKIYLVIGSHDERVSTRSCVQLFLDLNAANAQRGFGRELVDLHVTPDPDHRCGDEWFERGMEILLNYATSRDRDSGG